VPTAETARVPLGSPGATAVAPLPSALRPAAQPRHGGGVPPPWHPARAKLTAHWKGRLRPSL